MRQAGACRRLAPGDPKMGNMYKCVVIIHHFCSFFFFCLFLKTKKAPLFLFPCPSCEKKGPIIVSASRWKYASLEMLCGEMGFWTNDVRPRTHFYPISSSCVKVLGCFRASDRRYYRILGKILEARSEGESPRVRLPSLLKVFSQYSLRVVLAFSSYATLLL